MKSRWGRGLSIIALLALPPAAPRGSAQTAPSPQNPAVQPPVVAVRIVTEDGRVLSESPSGISVEVGKPLDRDQVAASIRALYGTGDYANCRAVVTPEGVGQRLDFVVRENLFYNQVIVQGLTPPPTDASAVAAMQLTLGKPYRQEDVDDGLERLREVLKDDGLYQAEVASEKIPHIGKHAMDVAIHIKPGPRARVESVHLKNATEFRDSELLSRLKMKTGQPLTAARIQRGTERIRKFLVKKGRLSTRATVRRGEYNLAKNTIPLELEVTEGA